MDRVYQPLLCQVGGSKICKCCSHQRNFMQTKPGMNLGGEEDLELNPKEKGCRV